jgi:outer membrane protein assembly factor BamB
MNAAPVPRSARWIFGLASCLACAAALAADPRPTWTQWRGPDRQSRVPGAAWPDRLQEKNLEQLWRVELGPSYSGPIVADDRVFVTETKDKEDEIVRALDRTTGKELWQAKWNGKFRMVGIAAVNGDWIRATPAYDGEALYVGGMRDVIVCLEGKSGKERWSTDLTKELGTRLQIFGFVSSPAVDDKGVYVQTGDLVVKLDKQSGKVLWKVGTKEADIKNAGAPMRPGPGGFGGGGATGVSSPLLTKLGDRSLLVAYISHTLAGLDVAEGKVIWKQDVPPSRNTIVTTPTPCGPNSLFLSGGRSLRIELEAKEEKAEVKTTWDARVGSYMASPVVVGENVYVFNASQRLVCLDLATGKERWTGDKRFGKYLSMVGGKDSILALDQNGTLYLIKADPEKFEILDSRKISKDETWAHLAVCGDEVYIRELNAMVVYRWKAAE